MIKKILFLLTLFCAAVVAQQSNNPQQTINKADKSFFIENKGQWNPEVKYLARIGGMNAWITNSGVVYDYYKINRSVDNAKTLKMNFTEKRDYENKNTTIQGHVVKLQLVNSENNITGVGNSQHEGYYNYFIGNDQSKWASNVPLYDNVEIQGVYKSIDVKYYYDNGMLRYDYKAKPGADISQIKFKFEGQDGISINANGELVLKTSIGEVTNGKIYAYQVENGAQKEVQCKFEQKTDGTIGLNAESYDAKKELIIDPLVYSTFIGGEFTDYSYSIALDSIGNTYITGQTFSVRYPVTIGAYETSGSNDNNTGNAFVTKIDTSGKNLIYSTYLGGTNVNAQSNSIAVDHYGNAYITGTSGSGYPTTAGVYLNNGNGVFITKLNSSGNSLAYSTYIGSGYGNAIAIDNNSNTYITGLSYSGYPTTPGAFQTKFGGGPEGMADVIVTKLNPQGTSLLYSTYIGSGYNEEGKSIAVDKDGEAYITGFASSTYYPTTTGAYKTSGGGSFITKLDANGSKLVYSTFIGNGYATAIAIDTNNNAYITGRTDDSNFPTTQGVYQSNLNGVYNTFITKLNNLGSSLIYSTYLGGSNMDLCTSIALDKSNNVYITGYTESKNYPITKDAFKTSLDMIEMNNGFISMLNTNGTFLIYSSLIDGQGQGLVADKSGDILITGYAGTTYLNILDKYNTTMSGLYADAFVTKITVPQVYIPAKVLNINPIN
ncbi:MAG: SBBP repeat-containing protein, partial [Ignavibacteriaceae bacterium]|nr:SBBP repeat-containing protein [Ignavibacteriaceae bacterium]